MKYTKSMRRLHWTMAIIVLGLVCAGRTMVSMDDTTPAKFAVMYPWHKSFGILALILAVVRLSTRVRSPMPAPPAGLRSWEVGSARVAHAALYVLMFLVPCLGYSMSSSYTQSDGVFFFGANLPELLPKDDARFEVFRWLHRVAAYTLLGVVTVHAAGALKHRFFDRDRRNDVLARML